MKIRFTLIFLSAILLELSVFTVSAQGIVGWIELAEIEPYGIRLRAKLDTGAEHSSLNTPNLKISTRKGVSYVHFTLRGRKGKVQEVELPVFRYASIRRHTGRSQKRPVVLMEICLGDVLKEVEVNLIDRTGFSYQLLLGRSFLAPDHLIDPSRELLSTPKCSKYIS